MWVIIALASLAALTIFALSVPLDMIVRASVNGRSGFRMKLVWLFGLVCKEIGAGKKKPGEKKKKIVKEKHKHRESKRRMENIFEILRTRGLLRQLKALIKDVLGCFEIRDFIADFRVGLCDPADTGLIFALIGPAIFKLGSSSAHQIRVEPSFEDEAVFECYSQGVVRLRPIQLAIPFLRFAFSPATIRVLKVLVLAKWKRKK